MRDKLFTRNFTFLILGQVSSLIGNYTLKFALSMYVLEQTGSASIYATLLAVAMLPTILLSPFGGILADRANRRNIMVGLDTLSGLTVLVAGLVLPFGHDIWVIGALLVILSVLAAFESPTVQACIPQMLSGNNLMKGNAAVNQVQAIAGLITPFLGSLVYAAFGLTPVLWGTVACFFLTAILECFIRLDYQKAEVTMSVREIIREDFSSAFTSCAGSSRVIAPACNPGQLVCSRYGGGRLSLLGADCSWTLGRALRSSGKCYGCSRRAGQPLCGNYSAEIPFALAGLCLYGTWP